MDVPTQDSVSRAIRFGEYQDQTLGGWLSEVSGRTGIGAQEVDTTNRIIAGYYDNSLGRFVTPQVGIAPQGYQSSSNPWSTLRTFASDIRQVIINS